MKIDDIPQDNSASYHGHRKVIYGPRDGHYEAATSNGWQDEAYATEMAVCELDAQTQAAPGWRMTMRWLSLPLGRRTLSRLMLTNEP